MGLRSRRSGSMERRGFKVIPDPAPIQSASRVTIFVDVLAPRISNRTYNRVV